MRNTLSALIAAHAHLVDALGYTDPITVRVGRLAVSQKRLQSRNELATLLEELRLPKPKPRQTPFCFLNTLSYQERIRKMDRGRKIDAVKQVRADYEDKCKKTLGLLEAKSYVEKLWGQTYDRKIDDFLANAEIPF